MRSVLMEVLAGMAWILFRTGAESRELEQNLRAVRWTIGTFHLLGTAPSVATGVAGAAGGDHGQLAASGGLLLLLLLSLFFCVRGYRKLAAALRDELVREVMES